MKRERKQSRKKKGWLLLAAAVCICVLFCGGCGREEDPVLQEPDAGREELVFWSYFETQAQRQGLDLLCRDFNQSQSRYHISWEYVPMTEFTKRLSSAFTENNLPDMAILDNPDMPMLIQLGLFEDITEPLSQWVEADAFYPSIMETTVYEGRCYGLPFDCNNTALIYNRTFLSEAGIEVPDSWEALRSAAAALTTKERAGFLMCGIEGEQGAFQILTWILAAGEEIEQPGGEKTEEAFAFLQSMIQDGSLPENCINLSQTDVAREFLDGKAAIMQNGPWVFPMLDEAGIDYGIAAIPGVDGAGAVVGGENIGVLKGKNREGALAFIRFCLESDALTEFCRESNVLPGEIAAAQEMAQSEERMQVFERQMHTAVTRTSIPHWSSSVGLRLTEGLYGLVSGKMTPGQIAQSLKNT